MNTLFVLLDGAEDDPVPEFGGKKPLDVAKMPFMASKAPHRAYTTGRGYTHLFLNEFFTGHPPEIARAALEGLGLGMNVKGRTAYRLSPAVIENGMINWSYHASEFCDRLIPKVLEEDLPAYGDLEDRMMMFLSRRTKRKLVVKQDWNRVQVRTRRNTYEYEKTTPAVGPPQVYHINGERYGVGIGKLSEYRQERKKTTPAPTPTSTPKAKRSSRGSGKTTVYDEARDYYEIDEYDDPEDFYEAFEDDFEDVEDAEDYWDEYHDE